MNRIFEVLKEFINLNKAVFTLDVKGADESAARLKSLFLSAGKDAGEAWNKGKVLGLADFAKDQTAKAASGGDAGGNTGLLGASLPKALPGVGKAGASGLGAGIAGVAGDARAAKSIVVNINGGLMSGNMIFQTTNINESKEKIREAINQALIEAVRDVEIIGGGHSQRAA